MDLYSHSVNVIQKNQDASGAYIACPNFPNYHFSWLRDGSFIAYAMDLSGNYASAERFYRWVGKAIERYSGKVQILAEQLRKGEKPDHRGILNTRFTLDGYEEGENGWGNFQVDGYGSWLWGLAEHIKLTGDQALLVDLEKPILTTIEYLKLVWKLPNYDCWEEHPDFLHPYSLATTYGGLVAAEWLQKSGFLHLADLRIEDLITEVKQFLINNAIYNGKFTKHVVPVVGGKSFSPEPVSGVDASLLGIAIPYRVFDPNDENVLTTIASIEKDLWHPGGGVFRYKADVYYGGGEWILLAAWLGWFYCQTGEIAKAEQLKKWIESVALENGDLPEQVSKNLLAPDERQQWVDNWGPIATPLLWSHAMYIILVDALKKANQ